MYSYEEIIDSLRKAVSSNSQCVNISVDGVFAIICAIEKLMARCHALEQGVDAVMDDREKLAAELDEALEDLDKANEKGGGSNQHDSVNHPSHYTSGGVECIKAIEASMTPEEFQGYCKGNCMKYIWRFRQKNGIEDLDKAAVYLGWLREIVAKQEVSE